MKKQKRIMAIHDISCVGRCSLTVALPIISAAGHDTGVLPTAVLSTHTGGFENFTFRDLTEDINPISDHWKSLGLEFDALYSGFLGSYDQIGMIADLFDRFKTDDKLVVVDPVMADNGELYSIYSSDMVQGMAKLCSKADIVIPNLTEASFILDVPYVGDNYDQKYIDNMLKNIAELGCKKVVLTGVSLDPSKLGAATYDTETGKIEYAFANKIEGNVHGTGDVFGSALVGALMNDFNLIDSTQIAVDYTQRCIQLTVDAKQETRYGVCFEKAIPFLLERMNLL